jgi:hypothetical protein
MKLTKLQDDLKFPYPGHEPTKGRKASHESLNVLDWTHLGNGRDFVRVCLNAAFGNNVPQELPSGTPKVHFSGFNLMLNP